MGAVVTVVGLIVLVGATALIVPVVAGRRQPTRQQRRRSPAGGVQGLSAFHRP